jgi:translocation and assembly module TamA
LTSGRARERARAAAVQRGLQLVLLFLGACGSTSDEASTEPVLASLEFRGNSAFSTDELLAGLANKPSSTFTTRRFDAAAFQGDLDRIVNTCHARGYFSARVRDVEIIPKGKDAVAVTVTLEEGLPSTVGSIDISGLTGLPLELEEALARPYPLVVGQIFREQDYLAMKADLARRFLAQAYVTVQVEGRAEVDRAAHRVAVTFDVHPGQRYRYSGYRISGAVKVAVPNIGTAVQPFIEPGHLYSEPDLVAAQKRLQSLGLFSSVQVIPGTPDPTTATVPIEVRVIEAPAETLRIGGGIGIDVTHQEVHLLVSYTDRNFLGNLRRLDFDNLFALVWVPTVIAPYPGYEAQPAFKSTLHLTQPEIRPNLDLSTLAQLQRQVELGYKYWAIRGQIGTPWRLNRTLTFTPSYNFEATFFDAQSFSGFDLSPTVLLSLDCSTCVLSYLEQRFVWDRRDDPIITTRGFYVSLTLQEAGLGGNFVDFKLNPEVRFYYPVTPRDVLAVHLEAGWLFGIGGSRTPVTQRFFLGGLSNARGYGATRLSPMVRVNTCSAPPISATEPNPLCTTPGDSIGVIDVPVGGNNMLAATVEVRHKISDLVGITAFADLAQVNDDVTHLSFAAFSLSAGLGLRITTPIGPFRLDAAYRVINPIRQITSTQGYYNQPVPCGGPGEPACTYYPPPDTSAGAVDNCGYPFVPRTGWEYQGNPYGRPSMCQSSFLDRLNISLAIGEAF